MRRSCSSLYQESTQVDYQRTRSPRNCKSPCTGSPDQSPMDSSCFHTTNMPSGEDYSVPNGLPGYAGLASNGECDEMMYHDPAKLQQWAASSATLPMTSEGDHNKDVGRDVFQCDFDFQASDSLYDGSLLSTTYTQPPFRTTSPGCASASTGPSDPRDSFTVDPVFENGMENQDFSCDSWMAKPNQAYDCSVPSKSPFRPVESRKQDNLYLGTSQYWMNNQTSLSQEDLNSCPGMFSAGQTTWSSPSTTSVEPSLGTSYPGDFFQPYLSSPTSMSAYEDLSSAASIDEPVLSPLTLGPSQCLPVNDAVNAYDASSTMRPYSGFQRPSIPQWNSNDSIYAPMVSHPDMFVYRRNSSEGSENTARRNELYQIGPKDDGLYHCPFAQDGCTHKPEKLKCNYDKHLDAHLKPYRCKDAGCADVPFSSTACLLRHEREAHGMHGHGDKPYLCTYEDCDRSIAGNGFPRRWNLQDHMKRVHDYTGPPTTGDKQSGATGTRGARKGKASSTSSGSTKRSKIGTITKTTTKSSLPPRQRQSIQKNLEDQFAFMDTGLSGQGNMSMDIVFPEHTLAAY